MKTAKSPINAVRIWVKAQPTKVKGFLAAIASLSAIVFIRHLVENRDNLFVAAEAVHALGISVLIYKLTKEKTCAGTFTLPCLVFFPHQFLVLSSYVISEILNLYVYEFSCVQLRLKICFSFPFSCSNVWKFMLAIWVITQESSFVWKTSSLYTKDLFWSLCLLNGGKLQPFLFYISSAKKVSIYIYRKSRLIDDSMCLLAIWHQFSLMHMSNVTYAHQICL